MSNRPSGNRIGKLSQWGVVQVGICLSGELSYWGFVLVGSCPIGELS